MGKPQTSRQLIDQVVLLRTQGFTINEIRHKLQMPKTTVYRYVQNIEILPEYKLTWYKKRGGSIQRMYRSKELADQNALDTIVSLSQNEKILFISALYWAEGNKKDLNFMNSDPNMIFLFVYGVQELFGVSRDRIRVSLRVYEDLDRQKCVEFWSNTTGVPKAEIAIESVKIGRKEGKLPYGMCRVRVTKGEHLLKYMHSLRARFFELYKLNLSPRSSMDRA